MDRSAVRLRLVIANGLAACLLACILEPDLGEKLGVPYRAQESFNYCAAASVLMWRLYDGLPEISQTSIYQYMQSSYCASNQAAVRDAVNHFTNTHDAVWDLDLSQHYDRLVSRQVTAFSAGLPVLPVVDYDHMGVLNGGKYHEDGPYEVWDFVYFHDPDPAVGANRKIFSSSWMDTFCPIYLSDCDQIVSSSAVQSWYSFYQSYAESVRLTGRLSSHGSWPPQV